MNTQHPAGNVDDLVAMAVSLGVQAEDLDEAVHDLSQQLGIWDVNSTDNLIEQELFILESEAEASEINNGGLDSQIEYLARHNERCVVEEIIKEGAKHVN